MINPDAYQDMINCLKATWFVKPYMEQSDTQCTVMHSAGM